MYSALYFKKAFLHLVYMYVNVEKGLKVYTPNCLVVNPKKSLIEELADKRGNSTFLSYIYVYIYILYICIGILTKMNSYFICIILMQNK